MIRGKDNKLFSLILDDKVADETKIKAYVTPLAITAGVPIVLAVLLIVHWCCYCCITLCCCKPERGEAEKIRIYTIVLFALGALMILIAILGIVVAFGLDNSMNNG